MQGNVSLQLYEINEAFKSLVEDEENINPETGELTDEAVKKLDSLGLQKQDLIHYIGLSYHTYLAEVQEVDIEIERLSKIKKHRNSKVNAMKRLLEKHVYLGEEMKFGNLEIKWKKNPPSVDVQDGLDLEEMHKAMPDLVRVNVSYALDKVKIKELHKANKPLPRGIKVIQNHSLQIK